MDTTHLLHPASPDEFLSAFAQLTGLELKEYIDAVSGIESEHIFLVGSIPQGSATPVSDIDLIVTGTHRYYPDDGVMWQQSAGGGVMVAEFFSEVNGHEIDITLVNLDAITGLVAGLASGNLHMSDLEFKVLSILKNGWQLQGQLEFDHLQSGDLELFSAIRHCTLALQEFNDALHAKDNGPFCLSMLRSVVFRIASSFLAMNGLCFTGPKWVKKAQHLHRNGPLSTASQALLQRMVALFTDDAPMTLKDLTGAITSVSALIDDFYQIALEDYLNFSIAIQINQEISALESANKEALCIILK
ncbi:hypothetical protein [Vibrio splendidus]|uniref:hypothetical protein n=1 Tax=Vibrio splendidus TaxID=29497 RepID=UPI003D148015